MEMVGFHSEDCMGTGAEINPEGYKDTVKDV